MAILSAILGALPIILEVIKLFMGTPKSEHEKLSEKIREDIRKIGSASDKAQETEGDTSDLEKIINQPRP